MDRGYGSPLTRRLILWSSPSWQAKYDQLINITSAFYRTRRLKTRHPVLNQMHEIHHLHTYSLRSISILSFNLCLRLARSLFPSGIRIKMFLHISHIRMHTTISTHLILLDQIILISPGEEIKLRVLSCADYTGKLFISHSMTLFYPHWIESV
jgi:hypothetical protein